MKSIIKLRSLEISNIKNVGYGLIDMDSKDGNLNILGVYGQNGSGKTTVVKSIEILKSMMTGTELPTEILAYIKEGEDSSVVKAGFDVAHDNKEYKISYSFRIKRYTRVFDEEEREGFIISAEHLTYSEKVDEKWTRNNTLFEYDIDKYSGIKPKKNYMSIVGDSQDKEDDIRLLIRNQLKHPKSVLFSIDFINMLKDSAFDDSLKNMLQWLKHYAKFYIIICDNEKNGIVNANIMIPFQFLQNYKDADELLTGGLSLMGTSQVPEVLYTKINKNISRISQVISQLVPNLSIKLNETARTINKKGESVVEVELVSVHNDVAIPIKLESDGIKKIVSILACIIAAFNNQSVLLAIDELDSGIFEFLLGEILESFYKEAKGQLIFTSHNFRALEILGKYNIVVTTTNEKRKFIRFKNIRPNNNLRDVFYHDLVLGGQDECLYEPTNIYRIGSAFRKAGDLID